jgi:hypothetical protein
MRRQSYDIGLGKDEIRRIVVDEVRVVSHDGGHESRGSRSADRSRGLTLGVSEGSQLTLTEPLRKVILSRRHA